MRRQLKHHQLAQGIGWIGFEKISITAFSFL